MGNQWPKALRLVCVCVFGRVFIMQNCVFLTFTCVGVLRCAVACVMDSWLCVSWEVSCWADNARAGNNWNTNLRLNLCFLLYFPSALSPSQHFMTSGAIFHLDLSWASTYTCTARRMQKLVCCRAICFDEGLFCTPSQGKKRRLSTLDARLAFYRNAVNRIMCGILQLASPLCCKCGSERAKSFSLGTGYINLWKIQCHKTNFTQWNHTSKTVLKIPFQVYFQLKCGYK